MIGARERCCGSAGGRRLCREFTYLGFSSLEPGPKKSFQERLGVLKAYPIDPPSGYYKYT